MNGRCEGFPPEDIHELQPLHEDDGIVQCRDCGRMWMVGQYMGTAAEQFMAIKRLNENWPT